MSTFFETYAIYIRLTLAAAVIAGTAYFSAHWATQIERASWLQKQAQQDQQTLHDIRKSELESQDTGVKYEAARAKVQRVVNTPDRKLDELLQTSAGDVVMPGDLGVRLNAIATSGDEDGASASQPDSGLHSAAAVPNRVGSASGVETPTRSEYGIGFRLPSTP